MWRFSHRLLRSAGSAAAAGSVVVTAAWGVSDATNSLCLPASAGRSAVVAVDPSKDLPPDVTATLRARFAAFAEKEHVPGLVFGIVRGDTLSTFEQMGVRDLESRRSPDASTLFRIASMSKAFTALAILKLRDEGKLRLDDLAEVYVPEMASWPAGPTADSPRIRVRDLLSHVAGFVTDDPWGDRQQTLSEEEFTRMLAEGFPFTRAPQTRHEYSNTGYAILGRIITAASGRAYETYIAEEILQPLGMHRTGYDVFAFPSGERAIGYRWEEGKYVQEPDMRQGAYGAMGGLQTSADDYARWVAFLLSAWPPRDAPETGPVRRSTVRELAQGLNFIFLARRPTLDATQPLVTVPTTYGMGMRAGVDPELSTVISHGGGYPGYGSFLLLLPDAETPTGLFCFTNRTYAWPAPTIYQAALELRKAGLLAPRTIPTSDALAAAHDAAGRIYAAGAVDAAAGLPAGALAMNFLLDKPPHVWKAELQHLRDDVGLCDSSRHTGKAALTAGGNLSGSFRWPCERGSVRGQLLLAPTKPPGIQDLELTAEKAVAAAGTTAIA